MNQRHKAHVTMAGFGFNAYDLFIVFGTLRRIRVKLLFSASHVQEVIESNLRVSLM